jgi:hypothetical protein
MIKIGISKSLCNLNLKIDAAESKILSTQTFGGLRQTQNEIEIFKLNLEFTITNAIQRLGLPRGSK